MMIITNPTQITPDWLTGVLYANGWLEQGKVVAVDKSAANPFISVIVSLTVHYSADVASKLPARMLLKIGAPHPAGDAMVGDPEVRFYTALASAAPGLPVVRCFDAAWDSSSGASHLLLHDVSNTHHMLEIEAPVSLVNATQMADALARLHAHWWDRAQLEQIRVCDGDVIAGKLASHLPGFLDFLGERTSTRRKRIYEQIIASLPGLLADRLSQRESLTIVHDDAHPWNFLLPNEQGNGPVYLVDWEQWGVSVGPHDLAYQISLFAYSGWRSQYEERLVRRYHEQLLAYGVTDYDWATCWGDYRLFVIRSLLVPMWAWIDGHWRPHRWAQIEKGMASFDDLGCVALLG